MRTLTRRLAPHARTCWLTFGAVLVVALVVAITVVLMTGGGRFALVATASTWFVGLVVLGALLDAVLVPGNPDLQRRVGHPAGWTAALPSGGGYDGGGLGDGGGSCG